MQVLSTCLFQFHKGSIRTRIAHKVIMTNSGFNSIKVQLERFYLSERRCNRALFQFHKGSIRTPISGNSNPCGVSFQFHKGSIRTGDKIAQMIIIPYRFNSIKVQLEPFSAFLSGAIDTSFNSIKVQLERAKEKIFIRGFPEFQFHKGSIRTRLSSNN